MPTRGRKILSIVVAGLSLAAVGQARPTVAQVPPSAAEIAAYRGLHAAAASGNLADLRNALAQTADRDMRDANGRTALHIAAHGGHYDAVRALANAGATMTALDNQKYDIITIAAVKDDPAMVRLAIERGANPRGITSPYDGTALIAAAHLGHDEVVRVLIASKAPLDHVNNLGWTAAIEAVILGNGGPRHQATLKAIVDAGANLTLADREGRTPLAHAKQRGFHAMEAIIAAAPPR